MSLGSRKKISIATTIPGNNFLDRVQQNKAPLQLNNQIPIVKSLKTNKQFFLPNAFNLKDKKLRRNRKLKPVFQNPLGDSKMFENNNNNNEFKRRSSSLAVLNNFSKSNQPKLSMNPSMPNLGTQKLNAEQFLPSLYIPASMYKKSVNQMSRKSRGAHRRNVSDALSRNPHKLVSTLSNKSIRKGQKSLDELEFLSKKKYITPQNKLIEEYKANKEPSIAIFAGFRTTKGYHPKKTDKPNQDRMMITSKFNNSQNQWVFLVLDGHGQDGHKVSQYVRDNLCSQLLKQKQDMLYLSKKAKQPPKHAGEEESLLYYSSVAEFTDVNNSKENELEFDKLEDEHTIFRQIQNYTKNVLIKKTFEAVNNNLK